MVQPALPSPLPLFPLTGSLLLPGNFLPLNIFEPRYRNMVADAVEEGQHIGMIQPFVPRQDNWPALDLPPENPALYQVGCAGRIERCEPQADGRYLLLLKGISRFRVRQELPLHRDYRRAEVEYAEFAADLKEAEHPLSPARLLAALKDFGTAHQLDLDYDLLGALPGVALVNGLAVALPFPPAEKQALLEAPDPAERQELLLALMGMGLEPASPEEYYSPPTLN
ncbi:MAG TPA: LON peptidase substrate-binding domain-containing protein [Thermoanaerobaculia bacterium]|nr:LON peptidase substrate-binding domain-containing protein [Thermoanaerobaculia bacterium]